MPGDQAPPPEQDVPTSVGRGSNATGRTYRDIRLVLVFFVTAAGCFIAAHWGVQLLMLPQNIAPIWPAAGVAVGAILASAAQYRTASFAGAIFGMIAFNVTMGRSAGVVLTLAASHIVEFALIVFFLQRWVGKDFDLTQLRNLWGLLIAAIFGSGVAGAISAIGLRRTGFTSSSIVEFWQVWIASNVIGIAAIAPAIVALGNVDWRTRKFERFDYENAAALLALGIVSYAILDRVPAMGAAWEAVPFAVLLPLLVWIGVQCPPVCSALGALIIAAFSIHGVVSNTGAFASPAIQAGERIGAAQLFVLSTTLCLQSLSILTEQRRRSENALQQSEHKFRAIYDRAYEFIGLLRPDGTLIDANQRALDFAECRLPEVAGKLFWETPWWAYSPPCREKLKAAIGEAAKGALVRFEATHRNHKGESIVVDFSLTPIFDDAGKVVFLQPEGRDITERKQAEEAAKKALRRADMALAAGNTGIWSLDTSTGLVELDDRARELWGMPPSGQYNVAEVKSRAHQEDHARLCTSLHEALDPKSKGQYEVECQITAHADQPERWLVVRGQAEFVDGRATRMLGTVRDITTRRRAEEIIARSKDRLEVQVAERTRQLEAMLDAAVSAILTIDTGGVIQSVNNATIKLFGYSKEELIGRNIRMLMPEPHRAKHDGYLKSYLDTGVKKIIGIGREMTACRKDGSLFPIHLAVSEFEADVRRYFTGIITDLTESKAAEEALRESERHLAQSQKMEAVGQLTGGLAHDINNMLTVVSGNLELAMPRIEDASARDAIQHALDAVEMGASLNRRLLTFARRRILDPINLDINLEVVAMTKLLGRTLGEDITLSTELAPNLWQTRADPSEVESALLNLAINARDAMPGGGRLTIRTRNITFDASMAASQPGLQPGDYVRLSVTDTGTGMTPDLARRAIEPFFTTKDQGKGTGLGLSSVYGFVRQLGGHLSIDSEVGSGTTVILDMPRVKLEKTPVAISSHAKEELPLGHGELVLVVDDNEPVREVTLKRVESLGYAVVEAQDGPSALQLINSGEPIELVLSDIIMPGGMSGYDLAKAIQNEKPSVKILLASGFNDQGAGTGADARQDFRVLSKPYSRVDLARALRSALGG
jgi:PAS domain S-box-containing protein